MVKSIERITFDDLPKYTSDEVALANSTAHFFDAVPRADSIEAALLGAFSQDKKAKAEITLDHVSFLDSQELLGPKKGYNALYVAVALPPQKGKAILEIDNYLFKNIVYELLGVTPDETLMQRPPSDVEKGVFSYLLLKFFHELHGLIGDSLPGRAQILGMANDIHLLGSHFDAQTHWASYHAMVRVGDKKGYVRLLMPKELVLALNMPVKTRQQEREVWRLAAQRAAGKSVPIRTQIGQLSLSASDLSGLETDDIILLEHPNVVLSEGGLSGNVGGTIGLPQAGTVQGKLILTQNGNYGLLVEQLSAAHTPLAKRAP